MTHSAEKDAREVWGIQYPPSVHVAHEYPEREWAERQLEFAPESAVLVRRFVTEWTAIPPAKGNDVPQHGDRSQCLECGGRVHYIEHSQWTGTHDEVLDAWWAHDVHPDNGHDARVGNWPTPVPCPECRQMKCQNCTDMVLNDNDDLEPCPCKEAGHTTGATT